MRTYTVNQTVRKYTVNLSGVKWRTTANGGTLTSIQSMEDALPGMFYEFVLEENHPDMGSKTGSLLVLKNGTEGTDQIATVGDYIYLKEADGHFRIIQSQNRSKEIILTDWKVIPLFTEGNYILKDQSTTANRPELFEAPTTGVTYQYNCTLIGSQDRFTLLMFRDQKKYVWDLKSDTITEMASGSTGGGTGGTVEPELYTNVNPSVETVGGIKPGTTFTNKTMSQMWDMALYPEKFPSFTIPTYAFSLTPTATLQEVGLTLNYAITDDFRRGTIAPAYGTSGFRSGASTGYTGDAGGDKTIALGNNFWTRTVSYSEGEQPLSLKGYDYDEPYPAGSLTASKTVVGVYPIFSTSSVITTLTKQALQAHGTDVSVSLIAESTDKQTVQIPQNTTITSLQQYNTLSGQWDNIDLTSFTKTAIQLTINGNIVDYWEYKHNGATIGARQLKFKV